jgi:hypothetical protein
LSRSSVFRKRIRRNPYHRQHSSQAIFRKQPFPNRVSLAGEEKPPLALAFPLSKAKAEAAASSNHQGENHEFCSQRGLVGKPEVQ